MKGLFLSLLLVSAGMTSAAIELPSFFSDGMVLQQKGKAKVWGWLDGSGSVTVTFAGQVESAKTNEEGRWEVVFKDLKASSQGAELVISDGAERKVIKDVLVGEVWIASGQSNMEWTVEKALNAKEEIAASADPALRIFLTRNVATNEQQIDFPGKWAAASPKTAGKMTAVGYYFARNLRQQLDVPVGIIECSWGGKPIEAFISEEALEKEPEAKYYLDKKRQAVARWNPEKMQAQYDAKVEKWAAEGKKRRKPQPQPAPSVSSRFHSTIYNGMIAPIVGYGAKGTIWYQGESNASEKEGPIYGEMLECLVADWRERWDSPLSFYYVQLANFERSRSKKGASEFGWIMVQDEMRRALADIEQSGMAVANDIGDAKDIHPKNKQEVGARLARWALGQDYGFKDIVMSGPLFKKAKKKGASYLVSFDHAEGLKARTGTVIRGFEIKAKAGAWVLALAEIKGAEVVVSATDVAEPVAVRYAWMENAAEVNLVNAEGLPTSCFSTEFE